MEDTSHGTNISLEGRELRSSLSSSSLSNGSSVISSPSQTEHSLLITQSTSSHLSSSINLPTVHSPHPSHPPHPHSHIPLGTPITTMNSMGQITSNSMSQMTSGINQLNHQQFNQADVDSDSDSDVDENDTPPTIIKRKSELPR
jgi:hypothetical protein